MQTVHRFMAGAMIVGTTACSEVPADQASPQAASEGLERKGLDASSTASEETFTAFESGQVRPLALSADGLHLYAVNTPDNRLEVFDVGSQQLASVGAVRVGLEPVAVAARSADEVWVVNHLSDSVSIVDVSNPLRPRVVRTLLVGDEPRDIVFAQDRAYITTAHRGQNTGMDPQLTTPGVGRADVWVFDPDALGDSLEGDAVTVVTLFADTPRALAVSPDGATVYAAGFASGNRTTVLPERVVTNFGGLPGIETNVEGVDAPWNSLIVKYREGPDGQMHWLDEEDRVWDAQMRFSLPDKDVFAIDATLPVPAEKANEAVPGVGTILFNMAVNPVSGKVYVSNLESRNEVRFEGHNDFGGGSSVRGHIAESRISIVDGSSVTHRHLNKHLDYSVDGTPAQAAKSLAFPTGMHVTSDGETLLVTALGSNKLGVFDTAELESDSFVPGQSQVALTGGGPTGLAVDEQSGVAYVMTRFDNGISVVDTQNLAETKHVTMYNPEPESITAGRRFLYDATYTSSHGDSACASCHVFGDLDQLAWDLGDPDGSMQPNPGPFTLILPDTDPTLHPMKGPMTTQSLRGMANHGPMHWRGDRTGGLSEPSAQPNSGAFDEDAAFNAFNAAFPGLLGRDSLLPADEMQAFTDFILQVTYPPNPIRNLDNSLTPMQQAGRDFYFNTDENGAPIPVDTFFNCNGCHTLDEDGNREFGEQFPGFFGTDGRITFENETQFFKVAHLRNMYQKVGMFGMPNTWGLPIDNPNRALAAFLPIQGLNDMTFQGDQIRGFGFQHDGSVDTLFRFVSANVFVSRAPTPEVPGNPGIPPDASGVLIRRQLEAFMLAFPSNLAPVVGQQVTVTRANASVVEPRIALLKQRAEAGECDLVVHGVLGGREHGYLYLPASGNYATDEGGEVISDTGLRQLRSVMAQTFTAVPVANGERIALDRDSDGILDGDE